MYELCQKIRLITKESILTSALMAIVVRICGRGFILYKEDVDLEYVLFPGVHYLPSYHKNFSPGIILTASD
jgi:hypothetical protein